MFIPDPDFDFYPSRIPGPWVKKAPDPGYGSATLPAGHRDTKTDTEGGEECALISWGGGGGTIRRQQNKNLCLFQHCFLHVKTVPNQQELKLGCSVYVNFYISASGEPLSGGR